MNLKAGDDAHKSVKELDQTNGSDGKFVHSKAKLEGKAKELKVPLKVKVSAVAITVGTSAAALRRTAALSRAKQMEGERLEKIRKDLERKEAVHAAEELKKEQQIEKARQLVRSNLSESAGILQQRKRREDEIIQNLLLKQQEKERTWEEQQNRLGEERLRKKEARKPEKRHQQVRLIKLILTYCQILSSNSNSNSIHQPRKKSGLTIAHYFESLKLT
jgi:hypothetical protein